MNCLCDATGVDAKSPAFNQPGFIWKLRSVVGYDVVSLSSCERLNRLLLERIKHDKAVHFGGRMRNSAVPRYR